MLTAQDKYRIISDLQTPEWKGFLKFLRTLAPSSPNSEKEAHNTIARYATREGFLQAVDVIESGEFPTVEDASKAYGTPDTLEEIK